MGKSLAVHRDWCKLDATGTAMEHSEMEIRHGAMLIPAWEFAVGQAGHHGGVWGGGLCTPLFFLDH